jgi:acyl-CoA thioesterase I
MLPVQTRPHGGLRTGAAILRRVALIAAVAAGALLPGAPVLADTVPPECAVPSAVSAMPGDLPRTARLIAVRKAVKILAIGSSSTAGVGASRPANAYPSRLEVAMKRCVPGLDVTVRNDGIGGEVAATTLKRLKRDVVDWKPDLVIWQVGTNDALQNRDPEAFAETVRNGVAWIVERGVDIVLIDPQFLPNVPHEAIYEGYVSLIDKVSRETGAPLMRRYAIMRHWATDPKGARMLSEAGLHMNDIGQQCLAETLAAALEAKVER